MPKIKTSINFYKRYIQSKDTTIPRLKKVLAYLAPFILLLGACALTAVFLFSNIALRQAKLDNITDYTDDPDVMAMYVTALDYQLKSGTAIKLISDIEMALADLDSYPLPNSKVVAEIERIAALRGITVSISGYSASAGMMTFTAKSASVEECNVYIEDLKKSDYFAGVMYTGYSETSGENGTKAYNINMVCVLSEIAGKD